MECSSKTEQNIDAIFQKLSEELLNQASQTVYNRDNTVVNLAEESKVAQIPNNVSYYQQCCGT
jgi:hypothetical protein